MRESTQNNKDINIILENSKYERMKLFLHSFHTREWVSKWKVNIFGQYIYIYIFVLLCFFFLPFSCFCFPFGFWFLLMFLIWLLLLSCFLSALFKIFASVLNTG